MPVSVTIDGNAVQITKGSLSVEKRIEERSTASFLVEDITGAGSYVRGMPVVISDPDATVIFAGFIDAPGHSRIGVGSNLVHDISCIDNHYLADKRLIVKVYTSQTLKVIVEDIITDYLAAEGITVGEVQVGPVIESAIFNYVKASDAFDSLKELSGYTWFIDEDKKLYFIDRTTNAAPWNLDSVTYRPIKESVHLNTGNPLYRNRQYVRGGTGLTAQQIETFTGDAVTVAFTVGYPISLAPTVTVNAVGQTVGIKGIDVGKDCYWNKGDATVTFAAAPGAVAVVVTYYGEYPLIARGDDPAEVAARLAVEGAGTGIVEEIVTEAQWDTVAGIRESARAKLMEFARDSERFVYQTTDAGLSPGQMQEITYSPFGFTAHEMLIESVSVSTMGGNLVLYDVTCITGPSLGSWSKFFSGILRRQDNSIKIGDSQLLVIFIQAESLTLVEATARHEDAFPPDVSRWIALPPAQGAGHHVRHEALALVETVDPGASAYQETETYLWDETGEYPYTYPIHYAGRGTKWDFFTWG